MQNVNSQRPGDNPGYIYLMECVEGWKAGLIKIGRTTGSPESRLTTLRFSGWKLRLVWSLKCADQVSTERALHTRFRQWHVTSECFDLLPEEIAWIMSQTEESICTGIDVHNFKRVTSPWPFPQRRPR